MNEPRTRERELRAMFEALQTLNVRDGLILSETSQDPIRQDDRTVAVRSIAECLLEESSSLGG